MIPWAGLLLSSFLLLSTASHAARRLSEPPVPDAGAIPDLPPGANMTALAESVPDETKAEYISSTGSGTPPADLSAPEELSQLAAGASSLQSLNIDIPDMPDVQMPDFSLPPIPQPSVSVFGHEFQLPSLVDVFGGGGGGGH